MYQRLGFESGPEQSEPEQLGPERRAMRTLIHWAMCFAAICIVAAQPADAQQAVQEIPMVQRAPVGQANAIASQAVPKPLAMEAPTANDRMIARMIANLMPREHVLAVGLNDELSKRAFKLFTESLDPLKLYFYQSDIDEFAASEKMIDDMVSQGDLSLAYKVFERFVQRVDERVAVANELLEGEFDFTKNEFIVIDPEAASYASNTDEARDRWRKQIKYALLDLKDEGKVGEEAIDTLRRRYKRYAKRWRKTDRDALVEMYLTAVTMGYDPHSTYMSPGSLEDFRIMMSLNLDGIGAQLREKDGVTEITRVIPGGAAAKHGKLMTDDVIVSVGQGDEGPMLDVVEMPLNDVVDKIRGKAGTTVRLGVKKGGVGEVVVYKIVRDRIELDEQAARGKVIEHEGTGPESGKLKIGYINLPSFYLDMQNAQRGATDFRSSTRDVQVILDDFKKQGVDGIVLDLSKNGGGSLTEAINLTGLFIDRGPVVQVKNADGSVQQYSDDTRGTSWDGPLVVLTSKFSASASEILAGAIRDYRRGIVVGDPTTHGKGTVQTLMDLGEKLFRNNRFKLGALKVTLQQFYLPDGESTQLLGVPADVLLPSITSHMDVGEGDLKFALEHDTVKSAKHVLYNMVPAGLIETIRKNSMERVKSDEEFTDLLRRVAIYVKQKEQNTVSLNEEEFMARRKELDSEKEEEEEALEAALSGKEIYRDNFYNKEVMNIVHDYVEGLRRQNLAVAN